MGKKSVWKYKLESGDPHSIEMPAGAQILTVQVQMGDPVIWALVDPDAEIETRNFRTFGTGHSIGVDVNKLVYIGTWQIFNGTLVFHLFEEVNHVPKV